jgi:hypothetical protein
MLRGLRESVRGVRFRINRREIAFFAPARESRLRAVMERGSSGAARCGNHRAAKFVKFVHFHSVISSNLPQGVSESGRWRVRRQRSCPKFAQLGCLSALPRRWGPPPHGRSVPQYARAERTSWAILPPGKCVERMPLADLLREMHRPLWERIAGVFCSGTEQQRTPSSCGISIASGRRGKHPSPPCDGKVRRCENCGDTGGSVEAFVEA